jgi:anti-sigma B factor antagonist
MLDLMGTVEAAELPGGQLVVSARGPLDARIATTLRDVLIPLAAADGTALVLDLGDAHGVDEVALGIIARTAHFVARRGERLTIVTRSPYVLSLVGDCGLGDIVTIHRSLKEAIRAD